MIEDVGLIELNKLLDSFKNMTNKEHEDLYRYCNLPDVCKNCNNNKNAFCNCILGTQVIY